MNKGRNIAILLLCLCCLSLLTFLNKLNRDNKSGVVDNVRYNLVSTVEYTKEYDFYFVEADKMTAKLITTEYKDDNGNVTSTEYSLSVVGYPYNYLVKGADKNSAVIEYFVSDDDAAKETGAFDLFTEAFILSMIYGAKPVLSVTQAIIVAFIAIIGGIILAKTEELWTYFNKDSGVEFPENEDLKKYQNVGFSVLGLSVILLLIFVIF